jgi:hypothetical protein
MICNGCFHVLGLFDLLGSVRINDFAITQELITDDWEQLLVPSDFESAKELQDDISILILVPLVAIFFNVL